MSTIKTNNDDFNLGERLKNTRKVRGYTQEKLAERLEISKDYVSRIEKGERQPSPHLKRAIEQWITEEWGGETMETPEEKLIRTYTGNTTKSAGIGRQNGQGAMDAEETVPIQEQVRRYDHLTIRFRHLFDFVLDTYGDNQVAIEDFAERLRKLLMTDRDYSDWAEEKRTEMEEALKKRAGDSGLDTLQKKIIGE